MAHEEHRMSCVGGDGGGDCTTEGDGEGAVTVAGVGVRGREVSSASSESGSM